MLRPILPHVAWQAIAALAGFFTLVCALAAPMDLWRLRVSSRQGEPFRATATLASVPEENISTECLSMGPESDAPGSDVPFLAKAELKLNAARATVEISTVEPVWVPALALVLRIQCAGAPLYARHFSALIPPAAAGANNRRADAPRLSGRRGVRLSLLPGDSVESIAAVIFPGQRAVQRDLVRQVIAGNPTAFPDGRTREVAAGTVLWFPDLRDIRAASRQKSPGTTASAGRHRPASAARPRQEPGEETPAKPGKPVTLRRALELGDTPGPRECKQLMELCATMPSAAAPGAPLEDKTRALESGVKQLHLRQEGIEQQLQRLEQSLQALQKTIASAPAGIHAPPAAPPAKVEVRTVVKAEPISWRIWATGGALILLAAFGGYAYGRRGLFSREMAETDVQLDRMLATAATVMREMEATPAQTRAPRIAVRAPSATTGRPPAAAPPAPVVSSAPPVEPARTPETAPATAVPDSEAAPADRPTVQAGLSTDVLFEMDQALDNTRSMFTDVDRFIALGRTQNALSLLQFQVHKDPKDRDSWIKLLAIYRQEKMDLELAKAVRQFTHNFPNEKPLGV